VPWSLGIVGLISVDLGVDDHHLVDPLMPFLKIVLVDGKNSDQCPEFSRKNNGEVYVGADFLRGPLLGLIVSEAKYCATGVDLG
jgi:hypothetical protein